MLAIFGSACFVIGGFMECIHNNVFQFKWKFTSPHHWLSICNFGGGLGFLAAGIVGIFQSSDYDTNRWGVDFMYLLGSALFLFGGLFALWLWKCEDFGLGLLSEMNVKAKPNVDTILKAQEQFGCGKSHWT
jgi:hypothetical protein